ncbi:hypothetical protein AB0K15_07030 [Amycolatopsis sp. NPDC049253]|uniref:hypothetical protein n=1 Tax=Amycolatopsis sp. NPDC049253 TaxID=3155274 RepID=UPI00342FC0F8
MKVYADRPVRRTAQVLSDVFAFGLLAFAAWLAVRVYDEVMRLRAPGDGLVDAGSGLRATFDAAADKAGQVPLIGHPLADALHSGSAAGTDLADAGRWQITAVEDLAWWLAVLVVSVPLVFLLVSWLPLRWHFTRGATAAARLRRQGADGLDLLALRALVTRPLPRKVRPGDLTTGWRERDPDVVADLAARELAHHGLRLPVVDRVGPVTGTRAR